VVAIAILAVAVVVANDDGDKTGAPASTTTTTATTKTERTTTSITVPPTTTTAAPITTASTRTTVPGTTTGEPVPVPGVVIAVAQSGGGSEEVQVDWTAVPHATGYRVLRADPGGSQYKVVADFDITTGHTTAAPDVVNIWSAGHSYVPDRGPLAGPDRSPWFQYVDYLSGERCYRVQAYNAAGNGPLSTVTCGAPGGGPPRPRR
jgi:hypothetical protein